MHACVCVGFGLFVRDHVSGVCGLPINTHRQFLKGGVSRSEKSEEWKVKTEQLILLQGTSEQGRLWFILR